VIPKVIAGLARFGSKEATGPPMYVRAKIEALLQQQRWDRVFILLYWLLFMYFGAINICFGQSRIRRIQSFTRPIGVIAGTLVLLTATVAAISDWREDDHIDDALGQIGRVSTLVPGREFGPTNPSRASGSLPAAGC
jgi:hypothetical protein